MVIGLLAGLLGSVGLAGQDRQGNRGHLLCDVRAAGEMPSPRDIFDEADGSGDQ